MISTGEAATLIYAAALGIASACFLLSLAVVWFVWRRFDNLLREKATEYERSLKECETHKREAEARVKTLTDLLIVYYPSMGMHLEAGEDLNVGADVIGRDKK